MIRKLVAGHDEAMAKWVSDTYNIPVAKYDLALGVVDSDGRVFGAVLFQYWNRFNVELCYYGQAALTPKVIRDLARVLVNILDVSRVTVHVSKRNRRMIRFLQTVGFKLEGTQRLFYGRRDCARNTAIRFVLFREQIDKLAGFEPQPEAQRC